MRRVWGPIAVALLLVAAGCGRDDNKTASESTTSSSSTTSTAAATTTSDPLPGASTTATSTPPSPPQAHLKAVRVAGQAGFDRVVFEFVPPSVPGYGIGYATGPITEDGS